MKRLHYVLFISCKVLSLTTSSCAADMFSGCRGSSVPADGGASTSHLILSGGEGYINFRIGESPTVVS